MGGWGVARGRARGGSGGEAASGRRGLERLTRACGLDWAALSETTVCAEWGWPVVGLNRIRALTEPGSRARELREPREPKECRILSTSSIRLDPKPGLLTPLSS